MRIRLLGVAAGFAAALFVPSAAFALDGPVVTAASPTNSVPVLNWLPVPGATSGFHVMRAVGTCAVVGGSLGPAGGLDPLPGATSFTDDPLLPEGHYCYEVDSDDSVTTTPSNQVDVIYDTTVPNAPGTPTGSSPVASAPAISFTPATDPVSGGTSSGIDHYDVYRDGLKMNAAPIPAGGPLSWSDDATDSLTPASGSNVYSYTVVAVDAANNVSVASGARAIAVDATAPTIPATPTGTSPVASVPTIAFAAVTDPLVNGVRSGVNHYDVYRGGVKVNNAPITGAGPFTWHDNVSESLTPASGSHAYSYTVVAVDAVGNASAPSTARLISMDADAPDVPVAPTGTSPVASVPTIAFAAVTDPLVNGVSSGVNHYDVYRGGVKVNNAPITGAGPFTWHDNVSESLTPASGSHAYSYTVVAVDAVGNTSSSTARVIELDSAPPFKPATPVGVALVSADPSFTFTPTTDQTVNTVTSGVDHYDVYRSTSGGPNVKVNSAVISAAGLWSDVAGQSASLPLAGLHTYLYTVVAVDAVGNSSVPSDPLSITLDTVGASAPTSVSALATPTNQHPQLSWAAPNPMAIVVDHYVVTRDGVQQGGNIPSTTTTFTDVAVGDGTYSYRVTAVDAGSAPGTASAQVIVTYDATPPVAPGAATATAALDGSISIGWGASSDTGSGIARYIVRRALSSIAPATAADGDAVCQGLVTACVDATAINGKLYSYAVFAVDAAGNTSAAGTSLGVTARDQLAPVAPSGLAATPGDTIVDLRWTAAGANDDVAGYVLVAKPGTVAPASDTDGARVCSTLTATSTTCSATGLTNGATYTFGLFALDEALNRSAAALVTAVPNGPVTDAKAPGAVKGLSAKVGGHTITLTWRNPPDKDFDHVEITASARKPATKKAAKRVYSGKGTKATTTLPAGQSRWFTVVAYDRVGNASAPATVRAAVAVASPFGPAPHATVHGAVQLHWPVVKGAKYYNVQLYAGKQRILASWPAGHAVQVPKAKLKRGTKYAWYVWPGLGAKSKAHYGKLIGKNVFTYAG